MGGLFKWKRYSWKQNRHQLLDTLTTLMEIYGDSVSGDSFSNEAEFKAYYIVLTIDDPLPLARIQHWNPQVLSHPLVKLGLQLHLFFQSKLHTHLLKTLAEPGTPYLIGCLLNSHLTACRNFILKSIHTTFSGAPMIFPNLS